MPTSGRFTHRQREYNLSRSCNGAIPQDLKFRGEETTAEIGNNNTIRENVTINRGTAAKGKTIVGSNNLLMEGVHVAHDAFIGNGCIIGNSTKMAGEIVIDDNSIISANVLMHQFCHVGGFGMIQGGCRFSKDIPPYIIAGREPICYAGINIVGTAPSRFLQRNHRGHSQRLPHILSKRT